MAQIFAPWVRYNNRRLPLELGTGPIVDGYENQHLWFTDKLSIQCVRDGAINHISNALPFDINGRLVVSTNDVAYLDQAVPFTALGAVAIKDALVDFVDQGVGFTESGHMASYIDTIVIPGEEWFKEFEEPPPSSTVPIEDFELDPAKTCISIQLVVTLRDDWDDIPDLHTFFQYRNTEASVDRFRAERNAGLLGYAIPADVSGSFVSQLEFASQALAGTTLDFRWTLKPAGSATGEGYRGWLDQINLDSNLTPTEFAQNLTEVVWDDTYFNLIALRINQTCDITDAEIIAWPNYNPKPPTWSPMPDQFNYEPSLPVPFDVTPYVNSFNGPVVNYTLTAPPAGFTIDSVTGIITAASGIVEDIHLLTVNAENDTGAPGSNGSLEWTVVAGAIPVWEVIPPISSRTEQETQYPVSGYVSSPTSTITGYSLVTPPTGFSINASGVITAAVGTAVAIHALTVEATNASGSANSLAFNWTILETLLVPQWTTIPDQDDFRDELPLPLDASLHVTSNNGPLTGWSLSPNPSGFSIDSDGLIVATQAASETLHTLQVQVSNASGPALSDPFDWNVKVFRLPPEWTTIPPQATRENLLPVPFDVSSYASSNSGALSGWAINPPVAGFTIDPAGVITAAGGTTVAIYALTVEVTNPQGTTPTTFDWNIQEELLPPVWSTIPDQTDRENTLPQSFEASLYVTSNDGQALFAWTLINAPAGFAVDTNGRVTCQAGTAVAAHTMQVRVSNNSGTSTSATFTWNVLEELLGPQWSTIPPQNDDEDTLPQSLDVAPYVTSNSGPLTGWTLIGAPASFTILGSVVTAEAGSSPGTPTITVRVSNDTGSADGSFVWTINSTIPIEYFHEFNADDGGFAFIRLSDGSAPQGTAESNARAFVGTSIGAYPGCPHNGSIFTPGADWMGLYLERAATNLILDSSDMVETPPWLLFETSYVVAGSPNILRRDDAGSFADVYQFGTALSVQRQVGSMDVQENAAYPGMAYLMSADAVATVPYTATSLLTRAWAIADIASCVALAAFTPDGSNRLNIDHGQVETGGSWTSAILTGNATATRAETLMRSSFGSLGLDQDEMRTNSCGQIKFYHAWTEDEMPSDRAFVLALDDGTATPNTNDYALIAFDSVTKDLYMEFAVGGVDVKITSTTISNPARFTLIDVRWKMEPTKFTVWFDVSEKIVSNTGGTWPLENAGALRRVDTATPGGRGPEQGNLILNTIRINSTAESDGTIEGWT